MKEANSQPSFERRSRTRSLSALPSTVLPSRADLAENSLPSFCMPLPETIAIRFTEDDAGYVTVRPVVRQTFRLAELADMVVSVTGKNAVRLQQIFRKL